MYLKVLYSVPERWLSFATASRLSSQAEVCGAGVLLLVTTSERLQRRTAAIQGVAEHVGWFRLGGAMPVEKVLWWRPLLVF
jgi:hypothetical protein